MSITTNSTNSQGLASLPQESPGGILCYRFRESKHACIKQTKNLYIKVKLFMDNDNPKKDLLSIHNMISCIGICAEDKDGNAEYEIISIDPLHPNESKVIREFWDTLEAIREKQTSGDVETSSISFEPIPVSLPVPTTSIVGFGIDSFDLPMILQRGTILKVNPPYNDLLTCSLYAISKKNRWEMNAATPYSEIVNIQKIWDCGSYAPSKTTFRDLFLTFYNPNEMPDFKHYYQSIVKNNEEVDSSNMFDQCVFDINQYFDHSSEERSKWICDPMHTVTDHYKGILSVLFDLYGLKTIYNSLVYA